MNQFHAQRLQRFYCLYVQEAAGTLVTWAAEIRLAFERARQNAHQPCLVVQLDLNDTKVEMRRVTSRSIPSWFPSTNQLVNQVTAMTEQPIIVTNVVIAPVTTLQPSEQIGIAIYWANGCDFDLYVKPNPGSRELYFQNNATSEGEYFHDFRGKRSDKSDFEFVNLKADTEIQKVRAWVNFYSGRTSSPIGIVILHYQGKTYESAFSFKSKSGNQGRDSERRSKSSHWCEIDLKRILGLTQ